MTENIIKKYGSKEIELTAGEKISISNYGGGIAKIYLFKKFANYNDHYVLEQTLVNDIIVLGPYPSVQKILIEADNSTVNYSTGTTLSYNYGSELGQMAGLRNRIINGNFDIWQRGTSFTLLSNAYTADRWYSNRSGADLDISQQAYTIGQIDVPGEPQYYMRIEATSADNLWGIMQRVDDVRTLAGEEVTFSFYAKADSSYTLRLNLTQDFGSGGSSEVIHSDLSNTVSTVWQRFSFSTTLKSMSGKTIGTDSFLSCQVLINDNTTGILDIDQVQLEPGPVATEFERLPLSLTQQLCHYYYWRGRAIGNGNGYFYGAAGNANMVAAYASFPVYMRSVPTVAIVNNPTYTNCSSLNVTESQAGFCERVTVTADGPYRTNGGLYDADAEI